MMKNTNRKKIYNRRSIMAILLAALVASTTIIPSFSDGGEIHLINDLGGYGGEMSLEAQAERDWNEDIVAVAKSTWLDAHAGEERERSDGYAASGSNLGRAEYIPASGSDLAWSQGGSSAYDVFEDIDDDAAASAVSSYLKKARKEERSKSGAFLRKMLKEAVIPEGGVPQDNDLKKEILALDKLNDDDYEVFRTDREYSPSAGDIIFVAGHISTGDESPASGSDIGTAVKSTAADPGRIVSMAVPAAAEPIYMEPAVVVSAAVTPVVIESATPSDLPNVAVETEVIISDDSQGPAAEIAADEAESMESEEAVPAETAAPAEDAVPAQMAAPAVESIPAEIPVPAETAAPEANQDLTFEEMQEILAAEQEKALKRNAKNAVLAGIVIAGPQDTGSDRIRFIYSTASDKIEIGVISRNEVRIIGYADMEELHDKYCGILEELEEELEEEEEAEIPEEELLDEIEIVPNEKTEYIWKNDAMTVTATLTDPEAVPDDAELVVTPVTKTTRGYNYQAYMDALTEEIGSADEGHTILYDVAFLVDEKDENGEKTGRTIELQPENDKVNVTFRFNDAQLTESIGAKYAEKVKVVHLPLAEAAKETADTTKDAVNIAASDIVPESLDAQVAVGTKSGRVEFETEGFSVFAIVYTVDFQYEIDGRVFESSIPGGGYISLKSLVEVLGIVDSSAGQTAGEYVENVNSAEFSSPELVWVGKTETETTVGQLKKDNKLVVQYSADLTKKEIETIDAQTVDAGDWALISILPFESEETLTITMNNGEQFEVRITDGQIKKKVITAKGETYEITVTYDDTAEIPEGAELSVKEILPESDAYPLYYYGAMDTVGTETGIPTDYVRLFDIEIQAEGQKVEPKAAVNVDITLVDAPEEELALVHFGEAGAVVMQSETNEEEKVGKEVRFTTEGFSVYAVIAKTGLPASVDDLDGYTVKMSVGGNYILSSAAPEVSNQPSKLGKSSSEDNAAEWTFEATGTAGVYHIFTRVNGEKKYINITNYSGGGGNANVILGDDPQELTVSNNESWYTIGANGYYINQYGGVNGNGFAGWNHADDNNSHITFTYTRRVADDNQYVVVVKYDDKYYSVLNDGTLEEIENYDVTYNQVYGITTDYPLTWQYADVDGGFNLRLPVSGTAFDGQQLAYCFNYHIIDPLVDDGFILREQEDRGSYTAGPIPEGPALHWTADNKLYATEGSSQRYIGVAADSEGLLKITGNQNSDNAVEILLASITDIPVDGWRPHRKHVVNHIDISIQGTSTVQVPMAYGDYYDEHGELVYTSTVSDHILTLQQLIPITENDIKNATVTASAVVDGVKQEIDNAFYVTGYSGNDENAGSTKQIRIEGSFKVANIDPDTWYTGSNGESVRGSDVNDWNHPEIRLDNRVYYTVSVTKNVTFPLTKDGQQLYDHQGNALQTTLPVTLSASFDYFDRRNECPPLYINYAVEDGLNAQKREWYEGGEIIDEGHTQTGMDFKLGTAESEDTAEVLAVEIVKYIVDEYGNIIHPSERIINAFDIYENLNGNDRDVIGVAIDSDKPVTDALYQGYSKLHEEARTVAVGTNGMGQTYDYDINANTKSPATGMYYVSEDPNSVPGTITDTSQKEWTYQGTYYATESPWRDNSAHDSAQHITDEVNIKNGQSLRNAAVPEVVGVYSDEEGNWQWDDNGTMKDIRNGFLEFYVYNVYESKKGDVSFYKTDAEGQALGGAVFTLFRTYENGVVSDELRTDGIVEATSAPDTGLVQFENVPEGTYYMQETVAPPNCKKSDTVYIVVIEDKEDGTKQSRITHLDGTPLADNKIKNDEGGYGTVTFEKVNSGHEVLQGAVFTLYRAASCSEGMELLINEQIVTATSGADGKVTFTASQTIDGALVEGIPTGNYYMKETTLPEGDYVPNNKRYFVHIGPTGDAHDESFIAELETNPSLNGMTLEQYYRGKSIDQVINYKEDELVVRKVWRDYYGNTMSYDGSVTLALIQWTKPREDFTVHVDYLYKGGDGGGSDAAHKDPESKWSYCMRSETGHGELTINWKYNQWTQGQSDISITDQFGNNYNSYIRKNGSSTRGDTGYAVIPARALPAVTDVLHIELLIGNNGYDTYDGSGNTVSFSGGNPTRTGGEKTVTLGQNGEWSEIFTVTGEGLLNESSTDLPAIYNGERCVYTIDEATLPPDFTVTYSTTTGIGSGILTAYNRKTKADLTIVKVDKNNRQTKLEGATFSMRLIDENATGVRYLDNEGDAVVKTTDANGTAVFGNLDPGYYEIRETVLPEGYILEGDSAFYIKVTVDDVFRIEKDLEQKPSEWATAEDTVMIAFERGTVTVANTPGAPLPNTGGPGSTLLYLYGTMLISFAGAGLLMKKRRKTAA